MEYESELAKLSAEVERMTLAYVDYISGQIKTMEEFNARLAECRG